MSSGGAATIWTADFSLSGRYLAVAGRDRTIKLFKVITTDDERMVQQMHDSQQVPTSKSYSAPVFLSTPIREFKGHSGEALTLSWSKNDFLLSGSTDKTVRLWHPSQPNCLRVFQHDKTVTSVAFHPIDDRFFLSGSFDATLRLWDIPGMSIVYSLPVADIITAVAFTPGGKVAICGTFNGTCIFLNTKGLTQINRLSIRSPEINSNACFKITGLQTSNPPDNFETPGQATLMITTNDSRVRIYRLSDNGLETTLEGIRNQSSQIHARFNDNGDYAICGSEGDEVHIWHLGSSELKEPYERFHTHSEVVTNAIMAPMATRQLIDLSKDPIYDLCNSCAPGLDDLYSSTNHAARLSQTSFRSSTKGKVRTISESATDRHPHGHIIVTTDTMGKIKVYRQDCAFSNRHQAHQNY
jgi:WD40 repeat protein